MPPLLPVPETWLDWVGTHSFGHCAVMVNWTSSVQQQEHTLQKRKERLRGRGVQQTVFRQRVKENTYPFLNQHFGQGMKRMLESVYLSSSDEAVQEPGILTPARIVAQRGSQMRKVERKFLSKVQTLCRFGNVARAVSADNEAECKRKFRL